MITTPAQIAPDIEQRLAGIMNAARARRAALDAFVETQPKSITCDHHPDVQRLLDFENSERATFAAREPRVVYEPCPRCVASALKREQDERLHRQGVPSVLLHCDFAGWKPQGEAEARHLATMKELARSKRGFAVLLGGVGTGKSHLAVATMRHFKQAAYVKQSTLLRRLRATYTDHAATDPIKDCQRAGMLVLDEVGVSGGGRDEAPLLSEILDFRHGEHRPTILTSNLDWPPFKEVIGERLADRLRESSHVLMFNGPSHRPQARERYFTPQP